MNRLLSLLLILGLLSAAAPLRAQDDWLPPDQRALVERAVRAVEATQAYTSFTAHLDQTLHDTSNQDSAFDDRHTITRRDAFFTLDSAGKPNIQVQQTMDIEGESSGWDTPYRYTLTSEIRLVDGLVYVRTERQSAQESILPPMPTGWLIAQSSAYKWAALDDLSLDAWINAPAEQRIFEPHFSSLLQETTQASLETGELDDGTPADWITLAINGADLRRGLAAYIEARTDNPASVVYYGSVDLTSTWTIRLALDGQDRIVAFEIEGSLRWTDFDLNLLSAQTDPGTLLNQTYDLHSVYRIRAINEPLAPVPAPPVDREEIYGMF